MDIEGPPEIKLHFGGSEYDLAQNIGQLIDEGTSLIFAGCKKCIAVCN
jgi:hypothetical protein